LKHIGSFDHDRDLAQFFVYAHQLVSKQSRKRFMQ